MAMAASSLSSFGGGQNVMLMRNDLGSSNSLVAMLTSCNPHVNFQVPRGGGGGGLEDAITGVKRAYPCYPPFDPSSLPLDADAEDDADDAGLGGGPVEKKRRLSFDQVRSLERNFEMENKLEPERKMQLAKELGLQPRQVAVWFQNRRARWKIKQLERDYEMLNSGYLQLKADFEIALREKDVLKAEVQRLSGKTSSHESQSVDSSQCDSESPSTRKLPDLEVCKESPIFEDMVKNPETTTTPTTTTSSGSHNSRSSELLDPESPRMRGNDHLLISEDHPQLAGYCNEFPTSSNSPTADRFAVGPGDDEDDSIVAVKLEEHGFQVDPSCGYFLPPMVEQGGLSWWDWA